MTPAGTFDVCKPDAVGDGQRLFRAIVPPELLDQLQPSAPPGRLHRLRHTLFEKLLRAVGQRKLPRKLLARRRRYPERKRQPPPAGSAAPAASPQSIDK